MKRWIFKLVIFLLLGAIVNVAVAWAGAWTASSGTIGSTDWYVLNRRYGAFSYGSSGPNDVFIRFGFPLLCFHHSGAAGNSNAIVSGDWVMLTIQSKPDPTATLFNSSVLPSQFVANSLSYAVVFWLLLRGMLLLRPLSWTPQDTPPSPSQYARRRVSLQLLLTAIIATVMAVAGIFFLNLWSGFQTTLWGYVWFIFVSVLIWTPLSFLLRRADPVRTILIGLISPLIGGCIMFPVFGAIAAFAAGVVTFPVGVLTAIFVRLAVLVSDRVVQRPGLCWKCGYDLGGLSGERCPECGARLLQSPREAPIDQAGVVPPPPRRDR